MSLKAMEGKEIVAVHLDFTPEEFAQFQAACLLDAGNTPETMLRRLVCIYMHEFPETLYHASGMDEEWGDKFRETKGIMTPATL